MKDDIAVSRRTALMMFWQAGWNTEEKLKKAIDLLDTLKPATEGYYYPSQVAALVEKSE